MYSSPWQAPAQQPGTSRNPYSGTYNLPIPTGNPADTMVNTAGQWLTQGTNGWQPMDSNPYPTGWNSSQMRYTAPQQQSGADPWQYDPSLSYLQNEKESQNYRTRAALSPEMLATARAFGNDWAFEPGEDRRAGRMEAQHDALAGIGTFNGLGWGDASGQAPGMTLGDFARQSVQNTVQNPAQQMYAGIPALAQMADKSDLAANLGLGNRWQKLAQQRNLQNMNVTLSTEPLEQQLSRFGMAAQAGLSQADLLRRMQNTNEQFDLARMLQGVNAARSLYGG